MGAARGWPQCDLLLQWSCSSPKQWQRVHPWSRAAGRFGHISPSGFLRVKRPGPPILFVPEFRADSRPHGTVRSKHGRGYGSCSSRMPPQAGCGIRSQRLRERALRGGVAPTSMLCYNRQEPVGFCSRVQQERALEAGPPMALAKRLPQLPIHSYSRFGRTPQGSMQWITPIGGTDLVPVRRRSWTASEGKGGRWNTGC